MASGDTGPIPMPGTGDPIPGIGDADPIPIGLGDRPPPSIEVGLVGSPFIEGTGEPAPSAPAGFDGNPLIDGNEEFGAMGADAEFKGGRSEDAGTGGIEV